MFGAVEEYPELDKDGEIIIISSEPSYSRPLISYFLGNRIKSDALTYRTESFFCESNVTTRFNETVSQLDLDNKQVILNRAIRFRTINY